MTGLLYSVARGSSKGKLRAVCTLSTALYLGGFPAMANPADTYGLGSRPVSMGGAAAADVSGFAANYYNPAGLALTEQLELGLGFQGVNPDLELDGASATTSPFGAWVLGFGVPGEIFGMPVGFGAAVHLAGARLSRITTFAEEDQRWVFHDDRPEQVFIAANAALRPFSWLAVGFGIGFLASTEGELLLTGRAVQPVLSGQSEYDSELSHEVIAELRSERYPLLGATVLPHEDWRFGLVYRGQASVVLDVDAELDGALGFGPVDLPTLFRLESTTVQSFIPRQLVLGASYQGFERWTLNVDLTWLQWSAYQSPLSATRNHLEVDLPPGFPNVLPELPAATDLEPARLEDRLVPRLGAEYRLTLAENWDLPLRAGYAFERSPVTGKSVPNLVDSDRHVTSLGVGLAGVEVTRWLAKIALETHLQWSEFSERNLASPSGESVVADGRIVVFGATLRVGF